jgi:flagellar hook assembly protein FlgD
MTASLTELNVEKTVSLRIYNVAGELVQTLVNEVQTPVGGGFSVTWDGKGNQNRR